MFREAAEAPLAVREQLRRNRNQVADAVAMLRELSLRVRVAARITRRPSRNTSSKRDSGFSRRRLRRQ
jgi:hypothetical protein